MPPSNVLADQRMGFEALEFLERRRDRDFGNSDGRQSRPTRGCRRSDRGTSRRRLNCRAASRTSAAPALCGACPARPATALSARCRISAARGRPTRSNLAMSCLPRLPRAPSANSVYLARSSMPRVKPALRLAVFADAHVAGGDAGNRAVLVIEDFGGGKARINLDARALRPWWRASGRPRRARRCSCHDCSSAAAS